MLTPRWKKVIRDLWSNKTKTILVVLAIAVGLFAFGSVFITQDLLEDSMGSEYAKVNSSSIIFYTTPFDDNLTRWVSRQPEVAQVQGMSSELIKMYGNGKTYNLTLITYDDNENITVNRIEQESGEWPPQRKDIIFERASLPLTGLSVGDTVTLETYTGRQYELPITGTVYDMKAFPGTMVPLPTAYVSLETLEWLGFSGKCNQLHIVTADKTTSIPELEDIAAVLRDRMTARGIQVYSTQISDPTEHWAQSTTDSFVLILSGLGFFTLILSGFLVINTISAMITQQKKQVGIMKAVGGTGKQIIGLYLTLVVCYGLLALLVAVPIAMGLSYIFVHMVSNLLNINIVDFYMPLRVIIMQLVAAILVPAIAAAIPIIGGVKVTVREALSDYGIAGKNKSGLFDRILMRLRVFSRPVLLSLRNTFRRKSRLALTLGSLILAGTLFIGVMNVRASLDEEFDNVFGIYYNWEVVLGFGDYYPAQSIETRTLAIPGVEAVESQTSIRVQRIKEDNTSGATFRIIGLSPENAFMNPDIAAGRWLREDDTNALVMTTALLNDMPDIELGDMISVDVNGRTRNFELVGIIPFEWDSAAYGNFNYISALNGTNGLTSSLYVKTIQKDAASQTLMAQTIEDKLKDTGISVASSLTQADIVGANEQQIDFLIYFLLIMAIMAALIGALGLMGMMSLNVMERTREIGVMRSIGATSKAIGAVVVTEGLIIGILSWLIAVPVSVPISMVFNSMLGSIMFSAPLAFLISPTGLTVWLVIVIAIAFISSLMPAYRAMRMSVRETLAYE